MKHLLCLIPLVACLWSPIAQAQPVGETVVTPFELQVEEAKAAHLRKRVNDAVVLVRAKRFPEAELALAALKKDFEATFNRDVQQYAFHSKEEFSEFKRSSTQAFEWIDWGYAECFTMQAFIAVEKRDFPSALSLLAAVEKVAPLAAGTGIERGYILNQLRKPEEALAAYERALSVSTRYRSQRPFQSAALRGIGFSLIELKRLDEAEAKFQESLKIEPNNKIALHELDYIRNLRSKQQ